MAKLSVFSMSVMIVSLVALASAAGCGKMAAIVAKTAVTDAAVRTVSRSSHDQLKRLLDAKNAQCPVKMDAFTSLERIETIDDVHIAYHYQVNQRGSKIVSDLDTRLLAESVIKQIQDSPIAVAIAERGLVVRHIYCDESGDEILSYEIDQAAMNGEFNSVGDDHSNPFAAITEAFEEEPGEAAAKSTPERAQPIESEMEAGDVKAEGKPQAEPLPENISPEHKDEPQPWRIQTNPYFEA